MRKIILCLAVSLDGYIEGPKGEYDWCFTDQDYGMKEFLSDIDTLFFGRKSYEMFGETGSGGPFASFKKCVFSNSLSSVKKGVQLINGDVKAKVLEMKSEPGKDIWLFGGASLTSSLMSLGLVDKLFLAVHPIMLSSGKPMVSDIVGRVNLQLTDTRVYDTGLVSLYYDIKHS